MKNLLLLLLVSVLNLSEGYTQISKASLQASGLTCAMCSKSILDNLEALPFVESVDTDLNASVFLITFKKDADIDVDILNKKVEDAGFSVANLKITAEFSNTAVKDDAHLWIGGKLFHFVNVGSRLLDKQVELKVIDQHFIANKDFKRYTTLTPMNCIKTGKSEDCCSSNSVNKSTRIYHVTI
ncbi:MAG: heavy-metal-associated domain-containing protein [bacterium]|jgi:copper chaperone CopZ